MITECPSDERKAPPSHVVESVDQCISDVPGAASAIGTCLAIGAREAEECAAPGDLTLDLTQIRERGEDGSLGDAEMNSVLACAAQAVAITVTTEDFRALPLAPSTIWVGPPGGWLPVNMVNVVYTDAAAQTLTTTILGQPVLVRATPVSYAWDFGDGNEPLVTTDPGKPHPDHTVSTTYTKVGVYTTTMSTTWSGEFSLDGGATYTAIAGTAQTTSTGTPVTVTELRSFLVDDLES